MSYFRHMWAAGIIQCKPFRWSFSQSQKIPSCARVDQYLTEKSRGLSLCSCLLSGSLPLEPWPLSSLDSNFSVGVGMGNGTARLPYFFLISQWLLFFVVWHAMFSNSFFHVLCPEFSCSCRVVNLATPHHLGQKWNWSLLFYYQQVCKHVLKHLALDIHVRMPKTCLWEMLPNSKFERTQ